MSNEKWKDIEGYEGRYQVSNLGNVKSLTRFIEYTSVKGKKYDRLFKGKTLKLKLDRCGYYSLSLSTKSKDKFFTVHRLVSLTFIPNPENKCCVNHKNGIKTDNRVENLEWNTTQENTEHARSSGLIPKGSKNHRSKINENQARVVKIYISKDFSLKTISEVLGISIHIVKGISANKVWKHVKI